MRGTKLKCIVVDFTVPMLTGGQAAAGYRMGLWLLCEAHLGRVNCNIPTIGNDCYIPSKAACLVVSNLIIAVRCVNAVQDRIMTGKQLSAGACGHLDIYKNQPVSQLHM